MISHKHQCIFVHIPKVAGTSIESYFINDLTSNEDYKDKLLLGENKNKHLPNRSLAHLTGNEMLSHKYISEELFNNYIKFSFVRNPVDRLFSFYKYLGYESIITFDIFIKYELKKLINSFKYGFFFKSQTEFIFNKTTNKNLMDFTGKFENLEEDFRVIQIKLNMPTTNLRHLNKGDLHWNLLRGFKKIIDNPKVLTNINLTKNKSAKLSEESKEIVFKYYSIDFDNFKYKI